MHYTSYLAEHLDLLKQFQAAIRQLPPYQMNLSELTEGDQAFMNTLDALCQASEWSDELNTKGQWLLDRIVMSYEHLLPYLSRDLFWFFGGNGLHYMSDEEIHFYQQLDELRHAAESQGRAFNSIEAKHFLQAQASNNPKS